ncbi:MAG: DUF3795 domain-containing protein [Anaerolineae bacterium]|nr:DUF3795 domain-containing protein [Anaerolineae bacterium]
MELTGKIIAYCGLICSDCPAYVATQADDVAALERMAADARARFNDSNITVESAKCDGCLGETQYKCGYCAECAVRACGVACGVLNCAHCPDYGCDKLTAFWAMAPKARATLEQVRLAR